MQADPLLPLAPTSLKEREWEVVVKFKSAKIALVGVIAGLSPCLSAARSICAEPAGSTIRPVAGSIREQSDSRKTIIADVDVRNMLRHVVAMPISSWKWKSDGSHGHTHLGPTAEDFSAALGLSGEDKLTGSSDAQGAAFAAIKGLYAELLDRDAKLESQSQQIAELKSVLITQRDFTACIEARLGKFETAGRPVAEDELPWILSPAEQSLLSP